MNNIIAENYQKVLERIEKAAARAGRNRDTITLVVVTKGQPVEKIHQVIEAGATQLGENYAEEGAEKRAQLLDFTNVKWHMIGHIQSRKARIVVENYDVIHSVDSLKLALKLEQYASDIGRRIPVLIELNVSGEESKYGFNAVERADLAGLFPELSEICRLEHLDVRGLMTMAPFYDEAEKARPVFRRLVEIRNELLKQIPEVEWKELSMGMSSDFEVAIEEGATMVRIGQAILGERHYK